MPWDGVKLTLPALAIRYASRPTGAPPKGPLGVTLGGPHPRSGWGGGNLSPWQHPSVALGNCPGAAGGAECCQGRRMPVGHAVTGVGSQWRPHQGGWWGTGGPPFGETPRPKPHGPLHGIPWRRGSGGRRLFYLGIHWWCLGAGLAGTCCWRAWL